MTDFRTNEPAERPYANTDEGAQSGFSNDDDTIRQQQDDDVADPNQDAPLPDPGGERHADVQFDNEDVGGAEDVNVASTTGSRFGLVRRLRR